MFYFVVVYEHMKCLCFTYAILIKRKKNWTRTSYTIQSLLLKDYTRNIPIGVLQVRQGGQLTISIQSLAMFSLFSELKYFYQCTNHCLMHSPILFFSVAEGNCFYNPNFEIFGNISKGILNGVIRKIQKVSQLDDPFIKCVKIILLDCIHFFCFCVIIQWNISNSNIA